jgi:hypothetical protein
MLVKRPSPAAFSAGTREVLSESPFESKRKPPLLYLIMIGHPYGYEPHKANTRINHRPIQIAYLDFPEQCLAISLYMREYSE